MAEINFVENFKWNEVELERGDPIREGLIAIFVIDCNLPRLIGTAFIVNAGGDHAFAISAAHCFEQVRKVIKPHQIHHHSALKEFLPLEEKIDFSSVKGLFLCGDTVFACQIEAAIWDNASDLAVLKILAPADNPALFRANFFLDATIPLVGEEVVMIGYGEMKVDPDGDNPNIGKIELRPIVRVGHIEESHADGYFMLKSPCVETSIAICGGMSGGAVARWSNGDGLIRPFAFISHAPEPQPFMDRSLSGRSVASILNMELTPLDNGEQMLSMRVNNIGCGQVKADVVFPFYQDP